MRTQRVKVRVRLPVEVVVFKDERQEEISHESPPGLEFLEVEGVFDVDASLSGSARDIAATSAALEEISEILSANMKQVGML